jgi:hypothetical protein
LRFFQVFSCGLNAILSSHDARNSKKGITNSKDSIEPLNDSRSIDIHTKDSAPTNGAKDTAADRKITH